MNTGRKEDRVSNAVAVTAFAVTVTVIVCMVWWPLPTAALVMAGSGIWAAGKP